VHEPIRFPRSLADALTDGRMNRRQLMRRLAVAGLSTGAIGAVLAACGGEQSATPTTSPSGAVTGAPVATKAGVASTIAPTTTAATAAASTGGSTATGTGAMAAAPSGIAAVPSGATGTPKRGGQITIAQQGDWTGFDPHRQNSACLFNYVYDSLINWEAQPDGSLKATPALATEWQLTDTAAIFKLRQGVKFHDGTDFNAESVKFNIERMKDAKSAAKAYVASIKSAEVVDPYTVKLNLTGPTGPILSNLSQAADAHGFMISKAMAEKAGDKYGTSPETTSGTGPMKLIEWVPTSYAVVQRTGSHWQTGIDGQPLPYFESIKTRFISDDAIRFVEVRSGNVQLIDNLQPKDVLTAQADPALAVLENPFQTTAYQFMFSTKTGPFADNLKLRQAVHYAINRDAVAKVLGLGTGKPMVHFLTPGYLGYDEQLPHYDFNLAKAKQLVTEAGYPSGLDIHLTMINRAVDTQQAQILKQMLEAAGIRVTIDPLERLAYNAKVATLDFEMATYLTGARPDSDSILSGRFQSDADKNYAGMKDPIMDDLLIKGRSSYDNAVRAAAYKDVEKRIYETAWFGTIWYRKYYDAGRKEIRGRVLTQEAEIGLRNAWIEK